MMTPVQHYEEASRLAELATQRLAQGDLVAAEVYSNTARAHAAVAAVAATDQLAQAARRLEGAS